MNRSEKQASWIQKRTNVCGGDACIRDTRHNVWGLVEWRRLGLSDAQILERHPDLTQADLDAAWEYFAQNPREIERALWLNGADQAVISGTPLAEVVAEGRRLGLTDAEIAGALGPLGDRVAWPASATSSKSSGA
jgi:uncharacterized protein (DUF433 family)